MILPVAGLLLLAALSSEASSRSIRSRSRTWFEPGTPIERFRVPRLWFEVEPSAVPAPFTWGSTHEPGIASHPYRTLHVYMAPQAFLELTNSNLDLVESKRKRMLEKLYGPALDMVQGEVPSNFPLPFLMLEHTDVGPRIVGHEGRHRALLALELGLSALPVVFVIRRAVDGWEHQRDTIDSDPFVLKMVEGRQALVRSQEWPSRKSSLVWVDPLTSRGESLSRRLFQMQLAITGRLPV